MTKRLANPKGVNDHTCLPMPERFWAKVGTPNARGCRKWLAYIGANGYGRFASYPGTTVAPRIAWELAHGEKVPEGLFVLHHCDNRACCEPSHLYVGTQMDNMRDMEARGRANRIGRLLYGEEHWLTTLTWDQVDEIRARYIPRKVTQDMLAKEYHVAGSTIGRIVRNEDWVQRG